MEIITLTPALGALAIVGAFVSGLILMIAFKPDVATVAEAEDDRNHEAGLLVLVLVLALAFALVVALGTGQIS